jgi:hypothetical protein
MHVDYSSTKKEYETYKIITPSVISMNVLVLFKVHRKMPNKLATLQQIN